MTDFDLRGIGATSQRARDRLAAHLRGSGITDERVLRAIAETPRHIFVEEAMQYLSYEDRALPVGHGQTISQPYIVALMTQAIIAKKPGRVLEIGTGSGYQAAVLSGLVDEVYTIERIEALVEYARARFEAMGLDNVHGRHGDGTKGWRAKAPFDAVIVTAGTNLVPEPLMDQVADGGRIVIPVGTDDIKELKMMDREGDDWHEKTLELVRFVPLRQGVS